MCSSDLISISSILGGFCLNSNVHFVFQKGYVLKFCNLPLLTCLVFVLAYSIIVGYVHKYGNNLGSSDLKGSLCWCMIHWGKWLVEECVLVTHRGAFLVIFNLRGSLLTMCSVLGKILLPFYDSLGSLFYHSLGRLRAILRRLCHSSITGTQHSSRRVGQVWKREDPSELVVYPHLPADKKPPLS